MQKPFVLLSLRYFQKKAAARYTRFPPQKRSNSCHFPRGLGTHCPHPIMVKFLYNKQGKWKAIIIKREEKGKKMKLFISKRPTASCAPSRGKSTKVEKLQGSTVASNPPGSLQALSPLLALTDPAFVSHVRPPRAPLSTALPSPLAYSALGRRTSGGRPTPSQDSPPDPRRPATNTKRRAEPQDLPPRTLYARRIIKSVTFSNYTRAHIFFSKLTTI